MIKKMFLCSGLTADDLHIRFKCRNGKKWRIRAFSPLWYICYMAASITALSAFFGLYMVMWVLI